MQGRRSPSLIDPLYSGGLFFATSHGSEDAEFKVSELKKLILRHGKSLKQKSTKIADIGCGTGATTYRIQAMMSELWDASVEVDGYDVHPHVHEIPEAPNVHFFAEDFCSHAHDPVYDIAILFDVIEHVPDPITFLREVGTSVRVLAAHIPLDDALCSWVRGLQADKLTLPGHLVVLDAAAALNLLAYSGFRVLDFAYSPAFRAPSGRETLLQRAFSPMRALSYLISPYLTQKLFGGVSLMVLARSPIGLNTH